MEKKFILKMGNFSNINLKRRKENGNILLQKIL